MNSNKLKAPALIAGAILFGVFSASAQSSAASMDMVDVSNNNGYMSAAEYTSMRNEFGVKAVTVKISEGVYFKDGYAASNIKNVQSAGLYVNGYHFARYQTKAQAIAEADFAGRTAKSAGLPVGAVLATDVEAQQQNDLSKATNTANNKAFMKEIKKFGYRPDIYTSGSWVNTKVTIKKGQGWIAAYPYTVAGKAWYTSNHGWQWSPTAHFRISYGGFDVSQLYDHYYTAGQKSKVKPTDKTAVKHQNKVANKAKRLVSKTKTKKIATQVYSQRGLFYPNRKLAVWTGTNKKANKVATYYKGESVSYNQVIIKPDRVWARYLRANGRNGFIKLGRNGGESYGKRVSGKKVSHTYYKVKSGDSLWVIARQYGTTVNRLTSLNGIRTTTVILPGQRLVVR
ncbi:GH25 family lysozyme [Lactiplantibacillus paraxiangfangensis]|uniref:GH25 family lysozyme n=1 Tax=Lactiplantibacillus paraxiangfangensis TaxID=3076224 RepID=UPI0030C70429